MIAPLSYWFFLKTLFACKTMPCRIVARAIPVRQILQISMAEKWTNKPAVEITAKTVMPEISPIDSQEEELFDTIPSAKIVTRALEDSFKIVPKAEGLSACSHDNSLMF